MTAHAMRQTLSGYAQLTRLSNLPTCVTNVLTGSAIALTNEPTQPPPWALVTLAICVVALLYTAGMAMNDAVDAASDAHTRPTRPIPTGQVSLRSATLFSVTAFLAAMALLSTRGVGPLVTVAMLAAAIVGYNLTHKRFAWSAVLMGLCRGLVYLTAATVVSPTRLWETGAVAWIFAGVLTGYAIAVTLLARGEHTAEAPSGRWLAVVLPLWVLAPAVVVCPYHLLLALLTATVLVAWLIRGARLIYQQPPRTVPAVHAWLAGYCLIDAYFLSLLGRPVLAGVAMGCFMMTIWAQRRVAGT